MKVPRDQPLFFTVFASLCVLGVLLFWVALPVHHSGLEEEVTGEKPRSPEEAIQRAEEVLRRVEETIEKVEAEQAERQRQGEHQKASQQRDEGGSPEERGKKKEEKGLRQPSLREGKQVVQGSGAHAERVTLVH